MENNEKTLEEQFLEIKQTLETRVSELEKQLSDRDNLIRKYMTTPSNAEPEPESDDLYTQKDVDDILHIIKRRKS